MNLENKPSKTLNISDNLNLNEIVVPDIPKNIIFPDELNRYLRDQIQYLTHENGMLSKNLIDNEDRLKESQLTINGLNAKVEEYNKCGAYTSSSLASSKIVELSKKLREKNAEYEVVKTKCSKLEKLLRQINEQGERDDPPEVISSETSLNPEKEDQLKLVQDKLNRTMQKLCEARNQNTQLKNDLKIANKFLQQEVGDNLETLQSTSNWRGRAQIIYDLQQKNSDLREKIKQEGKPESKPENPPQRVYEQRVEFLVKENRTLKESLNEFKTKLEASKSRTKVFENECATLRTKISEISAEKERDYESINTLTSERTRLQDKHKEVLKERQKLIQKLEKEVKTLKQELGKETAKLENLQNESQEKSGEIEKLKAKLRPNRPLSSLIQNDTKTAGFLKAERLRLLELLNVTQGRLDTANESHERCKLDCVKERQKAAKLESKVARLQLDRKGSTYSIDSTYSIPLAESREILEDHLVIAQERIKALETRLNIERQEKNQDLKEFSRILQNYNVDDNV